MIRTRYHVLPLLATLLLSVPACGQRSNTHIESRGTSRIVEQNGDHRREVRMNGEVEVNEAGDWVTSISPGGRLVVEEADGRRERRAEFTGDGGSVRVRYLVDGREREMDAAGREWARASILHAVRQSGLGAERRVASIRRRGGVPAVLAEIGRIDGDVARRMYFHALLRGGALSSAEFARTMEAVRRFDSDVERRLVLSTAAEQARDAGRAAAVIGAMQGMDSDVERRLVLHQVLERGTLAGPAQAAFYDQVEEMDSDVERRLVLRRVLERAGASGLREPFFRAVDGIDSDVEKRIVLTAVLEGDAGEAATVAALRSAAGIDSDVEKRIVLMRVPAAQLRNPRVTAAYRQVVDRIDSDHERSTVLRRLARGN